MNRNSVFMTAVWAGLAAPGTLYGANPSYRPQIADANFSASFMLVGVFLSDAVELMENDGQPKTNASQPAEYQLSLQFG